MTSTTPTALTTPTSFNGQLPPSLELHAGFDPLRLRFLALSTPTRDRDEYEERSMIFDELHMLPALEELTLVYDWWEGEMDMSGGSMILDLDDNDDVLKFH